MFLNISDIFSLSFIFVLIFFVLMVGRKKCYNLSKRQQLRRRNQRILHTYNLNKNNIFSNSTNINNDDSPQIISKNIIDDGPKPSTSSATSAFNVNDFRDDFDVFENDNSFQDTPSSDDFNSDNYPDSDDSFYSDKDIDNADFLSNIFRLNLDNFDLDKEKDKDSNLATFIKFWHIKNRITRTATDQLLHALQSVGHNLPSTIRTLIKTPRCHKNIINMGTGKFVYYSLKQAIIDQLSHLNLSSLPDVLSLYINVDGLPISKSSKSQFWPILGRINNITYLGVFIIAIYHGTGKPPISDFFLNFIEEYSFLKTEGLIFKNRTFIINIKGFLADTPARNFICCFPGHNSRCGNCIQERKTINSRRLFLENNSEARSENTVRYNLPKKFFNVTSPLEDVGFHMINDFPLDYMHLICLGIMKKLLVIWVTTLKSKKHTAKKLTELNDFIATLSSTIPSDFVRKPRSLNDVNQWKASEFRLFLLYLGPVLLPQILDQTSLLHFNALSCAIRILCDPKVCQVHDEYAHSLLVYFVKTMSILYGDSHLTHNMHNLMHITNCVKIHGNLDQFSCFPFENFLFCIKNMLKTGNLPLQQVLNRTIEKAKNVPLNVKLPSEFKLLKDKNAINTELTVDCEEVYSTIEFPSFSLTNKSPNNCCYLKSNKIVIITLICLFKQKEVVFGREVIPSNGLNHYPCDSREIGIFELVELSEVKNWPINEILCKGFAVFNSESSYVFPILHCD